MSTVTTSTTKYTKTALTVKDLIQTLQAFDPDLPVFCADEDGEELEVTAVANPMLEEVFFSEFSGRLVYWDEFRHDTTTDGVYGVVFHGVYA